MIYEVKVIREQYAVTTVEARSDAQAEHLAKVKTIHNAADMGWVTDKIQIADIDVKDPITVGSEVYAFIDPLTITHVPDESIIDLFVVGEVVDIDSTTVTVKVSDDTHTVSRALVAGDPLDLFRQIAVIHVFKLSAAKRSWEELLETYSTPMDTNNAEEEEK